MVEILWGFCVSEDSMTAEMIALTNPWEQIKARLTTRVSARAYEDWVTRTVFDGSEGGVLRVTVPDQVSKTWMEQEYAEDIREAIRELNLPVERVVYTTQPSGAAPSPSGQSQEPMFGSPSSQLNRKFRFDNYVVGSCNQFAHAAARAVANSPSRTYNPLFIYGGFGHGEDSPDALDWHGARRAVRFDAHRLHVQRTLHERDD